MELISTHFSKIKNHLDLQVDFIDQVCEIIYQISGVNLTINKIIWRAPALIIKAPPTARNLVLRHREKILAALTARFDRAAPQSIR